MAFAGVVGFAFTIVSSLVPLTLMVTATASLVYLHSRFVDQPPGVDLEEHRVAALREQVRGRVSASVFAAAVGFAALAVSQIRPIRELGIWTAGGLALGWVVCFTLYPALQVILRAPTRQERRGRGRLGGARRGGAPALVVPLALAAAAGVAGAGPRRPGRAPRHPGPRSRRCGSRPTPSTTSTATCRCGRTPATFGDHVLGLDLGQGAG